MDQSKGTRGAEPGTFDVVENLRFRSGGLEKRCGSDGLTGATTGGSTAHSLADSASDPRPTEHPAFIQRIGTQKVAGTSAGVAFARSGSTWLVAAAFSAAQPVRKRLGIAPSLTSRPLGPYVAGTAITPAGYVCTAAGFGRDLRITVESPDGALLYERSTIVGAAGVIVRVVGVGETFYVLYQGSASTTVSYRSLTVANGAITDNGTGTIVTLANAASTWDASGYQLGLWFLVYQSGATTVTVAKMDITTILASATFATTDNRTYLSVWADAVTDRIWVGVVDDPATTNTAQFRVYTDTPTLSIGPTTLSTGTSIGPPLFGPSYVRSPAAGDAFAVLALDTTSLGAGTSPIRVLSWRIASGTASGWGVAFNVVPISKPDEQQRVWCMTYSPGSNFEEARVALLRFTDADLGGVGGGAPATVEIASPLMVAPGSSYHPAAAGRVGFHAVAVQSESAGDSTLFALPFVLTSRTNASGNAEPVTRAEVYEYTRWNQEPHRQLAPAGSVAIVTGQPTELFGVETQGNGSPYANGGVELGYLHAPTILGATITPNSIPSLAVGTYVYQALQQWVDDEGNRHLSAPSAPFTVTLTVPSSVLLNIAGVYAGQRLAPNHDIASASPETLVYRTQNGGTEAQQVPVSTVEPSVSWLGYVTFLDTVADSIIDDNEFIYTAGGVLPNVLAPSCRYIAVSEERLWCGGLWDSNIIECSKVRVPGEPFNFTGDASHQVVIPGEVSGLAYMDGQVCVFTEDAIYLVSGDGPNDQGAGGFAPPRALVRGVGCPREQSASILETEIGIIFRSKMGFYVIPRGYGSPQFIGGNVELEPDVVLSAATTTTSRYRLARFLVCDTGETKSARSLVLDLSNGQWVRDTYTVDGASITGQGFSEIGEWPDGLALMAYGLDRADNPSVVWAEDEDFTGDAGAAGVEASTYISTQIRSTWMDPFGPLGWGRLTRVLVSMEAIGASSLVSLGIEADSNAAQPSQWTVTTAESISYRGASVGQPTGTAFRVTLSDAAGGPNSAGVRFLGLGLEVQPVGGLRAVTDSEAA